MEVTNIRNSDNKRKVYCTMDRGSFVLSIIIQRLAKTDKHP